MHYNYHRYYNAGVGRYLRVDPIYTQRIINSVIKVKTNSYAYVSNNPHNSKDFNGLADSTPTAQPGDGLDIIIFFTKYSADTSSSAEAMDLIYKEERKIECGVLKPGTICYDPWPFPHDVTVTAGEENIHSSHLTCEKITLKGRKDCCNPLTLE